jgi:hypothetical protein
VNVLLAMFKPCCTKNTCMQVQSHMDSGNGGVGNMCSCGVQDQKKIVLFRPNYNTCCIMIASSRVQQVKLQWHSRQDLLKCHMLMLAGPGGRVLHLQARCAHASPTQHSIDHRIRAWD